MERKRRSYYRILTLSLALTGCINDGSDFFIPEHEMENTSFIFGCSSPETKAIIPKEDQINDVNLIIFEDGTAEHIIWERDLPDEDTAGIDVKLVKGHTYSVFAAANLGRRLEVKGLDDLKDFRHELSGSDGYSNGIPMSAFIEEMTSGKDKTVRMELVRMAAKISISLDRSRLSKGVEMDVKEVRIGNCPRSVSLTGPSKIMSRYDRFETGFNLTEDQCAPLNTIRSTGISDAVSLYMLENMQGDFPHPIGEDEEKIFDSSDPQAEVCSFIEMEIFYRSSQLISYDSNLRYRFYLGDGLDNLDIERNCHYHITVSPEDDGLSSGGWRVDKSGIGPSTPVFNMLPGNYVEGHVGDTIRVWCECYPRTAPFDPGYDELYYDKSRGIYDFKVDEDMHGVTLYLKKAGTGIIYMSAGEPISRSGMVIVSVLP